MVTATGKPNPTPEVIYPESSSGSVRVSEILKDQQLRLEATAYGVAMRRAVAAVRNSAFGGVPLYGAGGLAHEAHNAFRFRRIFVSKEHGVPFLSSSDIIDIRPTPDTYLSRKFTDGLADLLVRKWDVLISCSGTVGNVYLAGDRLTGMALSQHVIRLRASDARLSGFISAFLRSSFGRPQLTEAAYGSVVQHIEPEHLERVLVPDVPAIRRLSIGAEMCRAVELRDEANRLLDDVDLRLAQALDLPPVERLTRKDRRRPIVKLSRMQDRFEGRFHDPAAQSLLDRLKKRSDGQAGLNTVAQVNAVTKFRKRLYVREGGMPLLPSKQLFQVDPVKVKGLARGAHLKDIPEIGLSENMILVTCSGTIGRVHIVPRYMAAWAASQDAIRVIAKDSPGAGYLYAWLASPHGQLLINRQAYGSVIVHIDREMLGGIPVPLIDTDHMKALNDQVLKANDLRQEAWEIERSSIRQVEKLVAGT